MYQFVIRRFVQMFLMLFAISVVIFLLFFVSPNDPAAFTCQQRCTPQIIKTNRHALGLDRPLPVQYVDWMKGIFVGRSFPDDPAIQKRAPETVTHCKAPALGYSFRDEVCVTEQLTEKLPVTFSIAVGAFTLWIVFGVGFGVLAALNRGRILDRAATAIALITYSLPS